MCVSEILDEAYARLHPTGPEWGDELSNHGPMAVEVLVRRGHADLVPRWVDRYLNRLDELPAPTGVITDWQDALGDFSRLGDWVGYFHNETQERPWRDVLAIWWPRLIPGIAAGATHSVIRVSHALRVLLAGDESPQAVAELVHGLAWWAARSTVIPNTAEPRGGLATKAAFDAVPRIPSQDGQLANRFGQLAELHSFPSALAALKPADTPEEARRRLTELVDAATLTYLTHGHGSPILLVHTATAPNAVLHALPALPEEQWAPSLTAAWAASAALIATYAPREAAPREVLPDAPESAAAVLDRAAENGDEHVIKFTDTAAEVHARTGDPDALAAAARIQEFIRPR
ncbi:hypothetical protein GCM10010171_41020 [Actinokineospora fastidiosa]|uniref:DUF4243 domain-containing protein n=1 Tax=Actinokineospora fastidiosa TaxID=1816 RepID=A0A918GKW4_9PSEU|nr:hypothetical protein GCM10010171_41020 [Actinokineospora fastidiosa]